MRKIKPNMLGKLICGLGGLIFTTLLICYQLFDQDVFAFIIYIEVLVVVLTTAIISVAWFMYKKGDTSVVYLFLTIERVGLAVTIATAMYARWLLLHSPDKCMGFLFNNPLWLHRNLFLAVGSTLYFCRVLYQLLIPFFCEKRLAECPTRRVNDDGTEKENN